jgi:hypothetical protein
MELKYMQSEDCRSWNEHINIEINDTKIFFPDISAVEKTLENLFLSYSTQFNYESDIFNIYVSNEKIMVKILNNEILIFDDESTLNILERYLCDLLTADVDILQ